MGVVSWLEGGPVWKDSVLHENADLSLRSTVTCGGHEITEGISQHRGVQGIPLMYMVEDNQDWFVAQAYNFEDRDAGIVYVAQPPEGVSLEAVLSRMLSRQLRSPVPLPLEAILAPNAATAAGSGFFLAAHITGRASSHSLVDSSFKNQI